MGNNFFLDILVTTSYLQVIAIDGGSGEDQLTTRVPVNISIADVNNKLPRLFVVVVVVVLFCFCPLFNQGVFEVVPIYIKSSKY